MTTSHPTHSLGCVIADIHQFSVRADVTRQFPLVMLAQNRGWPTTIADALAIQECDPQRHVRGEASSRIVISITATSPPNTEMWKKLGCPVLED